MSTRPRLRLTVPLSLGGLGFVAPSLCYAADDTAAAEATGADATVQAQASAKDFEREGIYFGAGLGAGAGGFQDLKHGVFRASVVVGYSLRPNITLGAHLSLTPSFPSGQAPLAFGGDIELTGYVHKGLFLRAAPGALSVQKRDDSGEYTVAPGFVAGIGYEWAMKEHNAAVSIGIDYDFRYTIDEDDARHIGLLSTRVAWF